ncbi:MAG TPA: hypothetical protein VNX68_03465 [Nitrosopumilaceae archaeon]|nr:hypothetical protein [Nitrosopumilaceae archaeon]
MFIKLSDKIVASYRWYTDWECEDENHLVIYEDHLSWGSSSIGHGQAYQQGNLESFGSFLAYCDQETSSVPSLGHQPTNQEIKEIILGLEPTPEVMNLDLSCWNKKLEEENLAYINSLISAREAEANRKNPTYTKLNSNEPAKQKIISILEEMIRIVKPFGTSSSNNLILSLNSCIQNVWNNNADVIPNLIFMFAPTGELQDYSIDTGWGDKFLELTSAFDEVAESVKEIDK